MEVDLRVVRWVRSFIGLTRGSEMSSLNLMTLKESIVNNGSRRKVKRLRSYDLNKD